MQYKFALYNGVDNNQDNLYINYMIAYVLFSVYCVSTNYLAHIVCPVVCIRVLSYATSNVIMIVFWYKHFVSLYLLMQLNKSIYSTQRQEFQ